MSKSTDLEKLEKLKQELNLRKKAYEAIEEAMDKDDNRILSPRNDIEHQKIKKEIKESKNEILRKLQTEKRKIKAESEALARKIQPAKK